MGTVKYTGPVASFHCPTNAEIRSLKVHFSPKQEGTGDPSPENVRPIVGWDGVEVSQHGKNLYSKDNVIPRGTDAEWNGIMGGVKSKFAVNAWPRWTFLAPAVPNATYYWTVAGYEVGFLDKDENVITYKNSWNNKKIVAPSNAAYVYHTWIKNETYYSQEQLDAAFKTYDLYCDISPTVFEEQNSKKTDYEFGVLGKNKFPASDGTTSDIFLAANTTYTISATSPSAGYFKGWYEDETDTGLIWINAGSDGNRRWKTFTPEKNIVKGVIYVGTGMSECQIELGSTATAYEPYDPKHTVYGGWVDLISGEVCEEYGLFVPDENSYITVISGNAYKQFRFQTAPAILNRNNGFCTHFTMTANPNVYGKTGMDWLNLACQLILQEDSSIYMTTINELKSWLVTQRENGTPFQIVYQAATPNTYHLAPTALQTFLGQNNVWSNADYVEVEYDLHETQSLLQRKAFIMANQPHIVKPAAAPLQNFVTDMATPVKECKVEFKPVQDTSNGAPSPDNICPVSGWTGLEVYRTGKNLLDEAYLSDLANYPIAGNYGYWYTDPIFLESNTTYKFSFATPQTYETTRYWAVKVYDDAYVDINDTGTVRYLVNNKVTANWSITTGAQGVIRFAVYGGQATLDDIWNNTTVQLELGSTTTSYESYSGTTIPIDWTTEAGTIYGGYVDLVKGKVQEEWGKIEINSDIFMSKNIMPNSDMYIFDIYGLYGGPYNSGQAQPSILSTNYDVKPMAELMAQNFPSNKVSLSNSGNRLCFFTTANKYATEEEFIASMLNETVIMKLAEPIHHQIDPITLKTLRGTNNIWSNANGNIELSYWKH